MHLILFCITLKLRVENQVHAFLFSFCVDQSFPGVGNDGQDQQKQNLPGASNTFNQGNVNRGSPVTPRNPSTAIGGPPSSFTPNPTGQGGPPYPYQSQATTQGSITVQPGMAPMGIPPRMGTPTSYGGQPPRQQRPPQPGYGQQGMGVPGSQMPPAGGQRLMGTPRPPMGRPPNPYNVPSMGGPPSSAGGYTGMPPTSFTAQAPVTSMPGSFPPTSFSGQQVPIGGPPLPGSGGMYNSGPPSGPTGMPPMRPSMPPSSTAPPGMPPMAKPGVPPSSTSYPQPPGMFPVSSGAPPPSSGMTQPPPVGTPTQTQRGGMGATPTRPKYPQMVGKQLLLT